MALQDGKQTFIDDLTKDVLSGAGGKYMEEAALKRYHKALAERIMIWFQTNATVDPVGSVTTSTKIK